MAFDGAMLHQIKKEIIEYGLEARVEKVYQPSREELVLALRQRAGAFRLYLTSRADCPRVHFTVQSIENPQTPPMFCMLLRKLLQGARLTEVSQPGMERVLRLRFDTTNELGDKVFYELIVEIMSRHSNIILIDQNGTIVDSVKRVTDEVSAVRQVLPGLIYAMPPVQNKLCLTDCAAEEILCALESLGAIEFAKALMGTLQGISPLIAREIAHYTTRGADLQFPELKDEHKDRLRFFLNRVKESIEQTGKPVILYDSTGKPFDFTFMDIQQYGLVMNSKEMESFSLLLDEFYKSKDTYQRMLQHSQELLKTLSNAAARISRKLNLQRADLVKCADREQHRVFGDLIQTNLYRMEKGMTVLECENYYEDNVPVKIPLDKLKTPVQNAQRYYKNYRKAQSAENHIKEQIKQGEGELLYIDSVLDALSRAETLREYTEIKIELAEQGYGKRSHSKTKAPAPLKPMAFTSPDGFQVLVGRNNKQNDLLTLKQARKTDLWFHTKGYPGSHTIVITEGREVPEATLLYAASLAAYYSKARDGAQVPVDYTIVKNVRKPAGAKPGMVIYDSNNTLYVSGTL